jgi:hypothetical protein
MSMAPSPVPQMINVAGLIWTMWWFENIPQNRQAQIGLPYCAVFSCRAPVASRHDNNSTATSRRLQTTLEFPKIACHQTWLRVDMLPSGNVRVSERVCFVCVHAPIGQTEEHVNWVTVLWREQKLGPIRTLEQEHIPELEMCNKWEHTLCSPAFHELTPTRLQARTEGDRMWAVHNNQFVDKFRVHERRQPSHCASPVVRDEHAWLTA